MLTICSTNVIVTDVYAYLVLDIIFLLRIKYWFPTAKLVNIKPVHLFTEWIIYLTMLCRFFAVITVFHNAVSDDLSR